MCLYHLIKHAKMKDCDPTTCMFVYKFIEWLVSSNKVTDMNCWNMEYIECRTEYEIPMKNLCMRVQ